MTRVKGWLSTRRGRFLSQIALLPVLYAASLPDPFFFTNVIFLIVVLVLPINIVVAALLEWSHRQAPEIESLRERADDAWTLVMMNLATVSTAIISILIRLGFEFPGRPALAILSWLAVLIAVPALAALRPWRAVWMPAIEKHLGREGRQDQ